MRSSVVRTQREWTMNPKRFVLASLVIFIFAVLWNGLIHLVILREADSVLTTIGRPESERSLVLSLLVPNSGIVGYYVVSLRRPGVLHLRHPGELGWRSGPRSNCPEESIAHYNVDGSKG
jgi:hypothetical protein